MKTDSRMLRSTLPVDGPAADPATAWSLQPAQVLRQDADGTVVLRCQGREHRAELASQVPGVIEGQFVLAALGSGQEAPAPGGGPLPSLIVAAWPCPGAPATPPWQFDRATGALSLEVTHLDVSAVSRVLLRCADARMQFSQDGSVETRGHQITSAAVETHRIEGGSIELN
ncbi:hypothetical protein AVHY2522_22330 [Acidovorax sp. SUPP2522]|uniref:hypothetical protein n=1 Tax=unclassified Acidovorax TaxID=2684926 RepID=UPI00234B1C17|nr:MULTISPECIES: hypothetical protein [unclassified Acidovorax]WCM96505.1 hypothetical protein M5C96_19030 [Acidovorax sp. GBBC 1281]GKT19400.1 hypothetical protein AVHY2522_22330 [Acidovorax sp. SUPP2522]